MNCKTPSFLYKTSVRDPLIVYPKNGSDFSLEELQHFVGGPIELINLGDCYLVVNEEGKLRRLPINWNATKMYCLIYSTVEYIVGDALLCYKDLIL